jgi:hypothetical protein
MKKSQSYYETIITELETDLHYISVERDQLIDLLQTLYLAARINGLDINSILSHPSEQHRRHLINLYGLGKHENQN